MVSGVGCVSAVVADAEGEDNGGEGGAIEEGVEIEGTGVGSWVKTRYENGLGRAMTARLMNTTPS